MAAAAILDLFEPEIAPLDPPSPKTHLEPNMKFACRDFYVFMGGCKCPVDLSVQLAKCFLLCLVLSWAK